MWTWSKGKTKEVGCSTLTLAVLHVNSQKFIYENACNVGVENYELQCMSNIKVLCVYLYTLKRYWVSNN